MELVDSWVSATEEKSPSGSHSKLEDKKEPVGSISSALLSISLSSMNPGVESSESVLAISSALSRYGIWLYMKGISAL